MKNVLFKAGLPDDKRAAELKKLQDALNTRSAENSNHAHMPVKKAAGAQE